MAQHFLLSASAKTVSLIEIANLTERKAEAIFRKLRWSSTGGSPVCPACGSMEHYDLSTRNVWKCKHCYKQFSVTSGTIFASHKLPVKTILMALTIFSNAAKGISALNLSRDLKIQYKTAFVLLHKVREALMETRDESPMSGVCEMDGAYFNGHVRPANNIADRVDRRLAENQNPNKRCVIVVTENGDCGSQRTRTFVTRGETASVISYIASQVILLGSVIHTDEANAYDPLHAIYKVMRVNHSEEYLSKEKACSNNAESFFSRLRRMMIGQHHHSISRYLDVYANEASYREDNRRKPNGYVLYDLVRKTMATVQSGEWTGYWQGNHRIAEQLVA